jgi:hypothetical protein
VRLRAGHTLAEALCALALGAVLAAAAGLMLASSRRALEESEMRSVGGRAEREAVAIVRKAVSAGESIVLHGDTAVELDLLIGASVLCDIEERAVLLPPLRTQSSLPLSAVPQLPTTDDVVLVRRFDGSADGQWWYGVVDSVAQRRLPSQCRAEDGWRAPADSAANLLRIVLADTTPVDLEVGAEVRILRRGRFALYHIGRGEWAIGWRRCHPWSGVCGTIQPVAAPLRAPSAAGFRIAATDHAWAIAALGVGGRGARATVPW